MTVRSREAYLDWLRMGAIIGVLFFHCAMPFVAEWDWHIKNKETSSLLLECNFFLSRFRMPLLFFIAGGVASKVLERNSTVQYIVLRFRRLVIPLLAGMLLMVPLQVYLERANQGFRGSFFDFYPRIFTSGVYPKGNLSWHHLWFIAYLFLYDLTLAPLFSWWQQKGSKWPLFQWLTAGCRVYLIMMPSVVYFSLMVLRFPQTNDLVHDGCWLVYWLLFMVAGFVCIYFQALSESLQRNRRLSLRFALFTFMLITYCRWNHMEPDGLGPGWKTDFRTYLYFSLYAMTAWFWVFTLIGYGRQYLNRTRDCLSYINGALYPFYILHQTVIVVLAYYVVGTSDTLFVKFCFLLIFTVGITMSIYHLWIRPFAFIALLFGTRPAAKVKKETAPQKINPLLPEKQLA